MEQLMAMLEDPSGLPDAVIYQYYKNLLNRKIIINEEIGDSLLETAILPFMEMDSDGSTSYHKSKKQDLPSSFTLWQWPQAWVH